MPDRVDTDVAAANQALLLLEQPPISTMTDANDRARAVNAAFAQARDVTLSLRWWNFATGKKWLTAVASYVHAGPLEIAYALPADFLAARYLDDEPEEPWEIETAAVDPSGAAVKVLTTNLAAPLLVYTRRVENVALWDPEFIEAFAHQLAYKAGAPFVDRGRLKELQALADAWRDEASGSDARQKSKGQVSRDVSWLRARRIGGFRG